MWCIACLTAIIWLIKQYPNITDAEICKLLRTTKNTVESIRNKSHWNIENIISKDPLKLGLCNEKDILKLTEKYGNNKDEEIEEQKQDSSSKDSIVE